METEHLSVILSSQRQFAFHINETLNVLFQVIRYQARIIFEQVIHCHLLATREGTLYVHIKQQLNSDTMQKILCSLFSLIILHYFI